MQYELVFRGSLVQYWNAIHDFLQHPSRKKANTPDSIRLSHHRPPKEFEEITIEFLDEQHRLGLVTVDALSGAAGKSTKLIVHIEQEAYEKASETALTKWNKLKTAWERKGWLIDPLAQYQAKEKRGKYSETQPKLNQVRKLRWEHIKKEHEVPAKAYILSMAKISHATCKAHDPELWKNWKDKDYE